MSAVNTSWEWKLEEYGIRAAAVIPYTSCVHHDADDQAKTERLVFTALTGEQDPPGMPVFKTTLDVELRSTSRNAAAVDDLFARLEEAFRNPLVGEYGRDAFPNGLFLDDEESTDARSDSRDTRKRSRTYHFNVGH